MNSSLVPADLKGTPDREERPFFDRQDCREFPVTSGAEYNVIDMNERRPQLPPEAAAETGSDNLYIEKLQVVGNGRG